VDVRGCLVLEQTRHSSYCRGLGKEEEAKWGGATTKAAIVTSVRRDGGRILYSSTYL
jgi:hypothetical protein